MSTVEQRPSELQELEEHALEHLQEPHEVEEVVLEERPEAPVPAIRLGIVVGFSILAAAVMVGGIFKGVSPRFWAAMAGCLGIALAVFIRRLKNPILINVGIVGGIFLIGLLVVIPAGSFSNLVDIGVFVRRSIEKSDVFKPPVDFVGGIGLGWRAIVGWLMAGLGVAAAWIAIELRKPALGIMAALPIVMISAISVPESQKIVSGLVAFVLYAIALGMLSGVDLTGDNESRSLGYELRRAARALPMIIGVTAGLAFLATQTSILFPQSLFDPSTEAKKPKYIPLTEVPDKVLFTVQSSISGPWRMGGLDIYRDNAWLIAPPKESEKELKPVPRSGIIDSELTAGIAATFEIRDLSGAVLPGLPNIQGVVAEGPLLAFDRRNANLRLAEGAIDTGLKYTVTAARIPTVEELKQVNIPPPSEVRRYVKMPVGPPAAVRSLIDKAPKGSPWEKFDYIRNEFLDIVIADGQGRPKDVPASRVQEMLAGNHKGTPYEIVAAQAMLARWAGLPARIGYGYDGGEAVGQGVVEVRPKHGASWVEIYFPSYKWLPVIGTPRQATSNIGAQETQQDRSLLPSDDIQVKVFVPFATDPRRFLFEQIRYAVLVALPFIFAAAAIYLSIPIVRKAIRRSRRRTWALQHGLKARIGLAYAEFRDLATDFGYRYESDTPLMFLDRMIPDEEHTELAWLVTRTLWGDLQDEVKMEDAVAAEELARSLKRRMGQAHSATLRAVALVSRLSIKHSYAPTLAAPERKKVDAAQKKAA